jgi:hypothetical protein
LGEALQTSQHRGLTLLGWGGSFGLLLSSFSWSFSGTLDWGNGSRLGGLNCRCAIRDGGNLRLLGLYGFFGWLVGSLLAEEALKAGLAASGLGLLLLWLDLFGLLLGLNWWDGISDDRSGCSLSNGF